MALIETETTTTEDKLAKWRAKTTVPAAELGRFVNVEETARRYGWHAVQPLLDAALTGDDLAMEVVEDFAAMRGRSGRKKFEQALEHGIETVEDAPDSMVRLFEELDTPPEWVDFDQLHRGSVAYFRPGPLVPFGLTCAVEACSMDAYGITRTVTFSGRFREYAGVRARETARWVVAACRPGGLDRHAEGFKLTAQVRLLHAMTRRGASMSPNWDWNDWGLPMPDIDALYAINFDFTWSYIDAMQSIGVGYTDQEIEDIFALWRYIGYLLGLKDHLLPRGPAQGRQLADMYLSMDPGGDEECRKLLHALIELSTPEEGGDLDIFPPAIMKLMPPLRLRAALYGFIRHWMGPDASERLAVPDTPWKYLPRAVKPVMVGHRVARKAFRLDDEKAANWTVALLEKASAPQEEGEATIAPHDTQEQNVTKGGELWADGRGRSDQFAGAPPKR